MPARRSAAQADRLDKYRSKRRFDRTPEPQGEPSRQAGKAGTLSFCVQKHLASHLHYDFRLEHEGVLLSWAVPKGPSLNPRDKRLAMQTEDHPLDYGDFEGVIPEGYGAGIVMLWDSGTWTPDEESADVQAALDRGELKFHLDGYKLKGGWVLVRTKGPHGGRGDGGKSWLLIKHRDDWSGEIDITGFAPRSVKSDGDLVDILTGQAPEIWESRGTTFSGQLDKSFPRIIQKALEIRKKHEK